MIFMLFLYNICIIFKIIIQELYMKYNYQSPKLTNLGSIITKTLENGDGGDPDGNGNGNTYAAPS